MTDPLHIRQAVPDDAEAMVRLWATAVPHLVRTVDGAAETLRRDDRLGRRTTVALDDADLVGTAVLVPAQQEQARLLLAVDPDRRRTGAGTALLADAEQTAREQGVSRVLCTANGDRDSLGFATAHGFSVEGEQRVSACDPHRVGAAAPTPGGFWLTRCDRLEDPLALVEAHNAAVADAGGEPLLPQRFWEGWWELPDSAPELSWAAVAGDHVAAYSLVEVDRQRARAWSSMTATRPGYQGRGLARWLKQVTLNGLAGDGVREALTAHDEANASILAVNEALGYHAVATTYTVSHDL